MDFGTWKEQVIALMEADKWTSIALRTVDWTAWKDCYFDQGLSPEEAMLSEYEAAYSGH